MGLDGEDIAGAEQIILRHPIRHDFQRSIDRAEIDHFEPLLEPAWSDGKRMIEAEPLDVPQARRESDLARLDPGVKRLMNPHVYHVSLTQALWDLKQDTVEAASDGWQE